MLKIYDYRVILLFLLIGCVSFFMGLDADFPVTADKLDFQLQNERKEALIRFVYIFTNNLKVGALIIFLGIVSGGLGSILIFSLNGYSFGLLVGTLFTYYSNPHNVILKHVLPHALTEVLAFCLCGCLGFKGFYFAKRIITSNEISISLLPKIKEIYLPLILFVASALIEAFISSGN